jgi:DUF1365 family protein
VAITPSIFFGKVMHRRFFPRENGFSYRIYYLAFPLAKMGELALKIGRFGMQSVAKQDHGPRDGSDLKSWAKDLLTAHNIDKANGDVVLMTMPRVLGYAFNPVSFWFCFDADENIRAVLCEVNNTFGESHVYICAHADQRVISHDDILMGEKVFHVSPFLERNGHYTFRFDLRSNKCGIWINYFAQNGDKQLVTALTGAFRPMTRRAMFAAFWSYPLVTLKAITLIHWQALKILAKKIKYISKPIQYKSNVTRANKITNN